MDKQDRTQQSRHQRGSYPRCRREAQRLRLREVEDACGVSNAYLSQLETGKIIKPSPHISLLQTSDAADAS